MMGSRVAVAQEESICSCETSPWHWSLGFFGFLCPACPIAAAYAAPLGWGQRCNPDGRGAERLPAPVDGHQGCCPDADALRKSTRSLSLRMPANGELDRMDCPLSVSDVATARASSRP